MGTGNEHADFIYLSPQPLSMYNIKAMIDKKLSEYFAALGRKSAKARMKKIAKQRKKIARNAAKTRWAEVVSGRKPSRRRA